jgi:hypothetical protein
MNILKISMFIGNQSDALTAGFEVIESTLLVEALRFEPERMGTHAYCQNCGIVSFKQCSQLPLLKQSIKCINAFPDC